MGEWVKKNKTIMMSQCHMQDQELLAGVLVWSNCKILELSGFNNLLRKIHLIR